MPLRSFQLREVDGENGGALRRRQGGQDDGRGGDDPHRFLGGGSEEDGRLGGRDGGRGGGRGQAAEHLCKEGRTRFSRGPSLLNVDDLILNM